MKPSPTRESPAGEPAPAPFAGFLAALSHELGNALNSVAIRAALGQQDRMSDHQRLSQLARIEHLVLEAKELVSNLSDLAAAIDGRLSAGPGPADVAQAIEQAVDALAERAEAAGVELEVDLPEGDLPPVRADERRIRQAVQNLLADGVRRLPHGGRVGVEARVEGDTLAVLLSDGGAPWAALELGIEPTEPLPPRRRTDPAWIGPGPAVSRAIARACGGDLTLAQADGGGTIWRLVLPIAG